MKIKVTALVRKGSSEHKETVYITEDEISAIAKKRIKEFDNFPIVRVETVEFLSDPMPSDLKAFCGKRV